MSPFRPCFPAFALAACLLAFHPDPALSSAPDLPAVLICGAQGDQDSPQMVPDGAGGAFLTWKDFRGLAISSYDIYVQRLSPAGAPLWTPNGVALCTAVSNQITPRIVPDGAGGAIVTWSDARLPDGNLDIYAQRISAAGVTQWKPDGVEVCNAHNPQYNPRIVSDGAGGAIIAWEDWRNPLGMDIYAQHITAGGAPLWGDSGQVVCAAADWQTNPDMVADGAGGAIITWQDLRGGPTADIHAQRMSASGVAQWAPDGIGVCTASSDQVTPALVPDGAGGAIIAWADYRSAPILIYAQRISAAGIPAWAANGVPLCTHGSGQLAPAIVPDGAGGAVVAWYGYGDGPDDDIFAQRISAAGVSQWGAGGAALCTVLGDQYEPRIAPDGAGGAFAIWTDGSGASYNLYAQHLVGDGVPVWPGERVPFGVADGVAVVTAAWEQSNPAIAASGPNGAIFAWQDARGADFDLYAAAVANAGVGVSASPPPPLLLAAPRPNPVRGNVTLDYALSRPGHVRLSVYDLTGRRVEVLVEGDQAAGAHHESFRLRDSAGGELASGVYLLRLEAEGSARTRRIALIR